jgi:mannose-6-phosphate isomerase-like protein (cupin superfamily)
MTIYKETRPWGWFEIIQEEPGYKIKKLFVEAGKRLSLQKHKLRDEHWMVLSGIGIAEVDSKEINLASGNHVFVSNNSQHRICAIEDLTLIEVQLGICDENDIIRFQDDFGRK